MLKINHITHEDGTIEALGVPAGCRIACIGGEFFALEPGEVLDTPSTTESDDASPES